MSQLEELTFEEAFHELEAAVADLEDGTLTIEDMVARFEQGMTLVALCRQRLDAAQTRVSALVRELDPLDVAQLADEEIDPEV